MTSSISTGLPSGVLPQRQPRLGVMIPAVVAHRGYHSAGPGKPFENTIEAFNAAIDLGADLLELDVRRTRDGVLVIHHDPTIGTLKIADLDYAQLPSVGDGTSRVPTLDDVIELAARRGARLDVELKEVGYELQVADRLLTRLGTDHFDVISFNKESIAAIERMRPQVRTGLLAYKMHAWMYNNPLFPLLKRILDPLALPVRNAARVGADYISIKDSIASDSMIDKAVKAGLGVDVWTVDDPAAIAKFLHDPRITGVVTNRPDLALKLRTDLVEAAQLVARHA